MAHEPARRPRSGSGLRRLLGLILAVAVTPAVASGEEGRTRWYHARTAVDTASACVVGAGGPAARARVTVVDRRGQICDVAGALTPLDRRAAWLLNKDGACALRIEVVRGTLSVVDTNAACRPLWCGRGVAIGSRSLPRSRAPLRSACEEP